MVLQPVSDIPWTSERGTTTSRRYARAAPGAAAQQREVDPKRALVHELKNEVGRLSLRLERLAALVNAPDVDRIR